MFLTITNSQSFFFSEKKHPTNNWLNWDRNCGKHFLYSLSQCCSSDTYNSLWVKDKTKCVKNFSLSSNYLPIRIIIKLSLINGRANFSFLLIFWVQYCRFRWKHDTLIGRVDQNHGAFRIVDTNIKSTEEQTFLSFWSNVFDYNNLWINIKSKDLNDWGIILTFAFDLDW